MANQIQKILAQLPSVDLLLKQIPNEGLTHSKVKERLQKILAEIRQAVLAGDMTEAPSEQEIIALTLDELDKHQYSFKRVINATGTILHTNLGRSNLSERVRQQLNEVSFNYSNLEFDLSNGQRGSRYSHLVSVIQKLTGAEDVIVVNNNAAAVLLALNTLADQKEVLVSRGELVEIGGAFRIPEVVTAAGGEIVEVGTTNRTHIKDFREGVNENTGALLKVHTSNYRIIGFTAKADLAELAELAKEHGLPLIDDLGSGLLIDMRQFGLPYEPSIREVLKLGADIVTFSGDKLLGGPQAGIIVGKKKYIEQMKKNQLLRAIRIDKMTLAALEATLSLYLDEKEAIREIPTLRMIAQKPEEIAEKAQALKEKLVDISDQLQAEVLPDDSKIGGGSYPEHLLPTFAVTLKSQTDTADELQTKLREQKVPIISRVKNERNYLDLRTIEVADFDWIEAAVREIFE
ncbi:L-seryl-tRNA(Sec) selenium transferase [Enterococcus alishanensis]